METVTNMASAVTDTAKKAIWGDQANVQGNETGGQEPISGQQGKGTIDSPYDRGNEEPSSLAGSDKTGLDASNPSGTTSTGQSEFASSGQSRMTFANPAGLDSATRSGLDHTTQTGLSQASSEPTSKSGLDPTNKSGVGSTAQSGLGSGNQPGLGSGNQSGFNTGGHPGVSGLSGDSGISSPSRGLESTSKTSAASSGPLGAAGGPKPTDPSTTGTGAPGPSSGTAAPELTPSDTPAESSGTRAATLAGPELGIADPSSAQQPTQKQQGADRPQATPPSSGKTGSNPRDSGVHTGVGDPHEGEDETAWRSEESAKHRDPNDRSGEPLRMHDGGGEGRTGGEERTRSGGLPQTDKASAGTGQHVVKTTGLAAEGGDFDATKPGAGVEAARIKEQHGVGEPAGSKMTKPPSPPSAGNTAGAGGSSPTKRHKLMEKLHLHKKS